LHDLLPRSYAPKDAFSVHPAALIDQGSETLICFSHLRWDFVFQRPQHLMTRFAATRRVIYWEEPIAAPMENAPSLDLKVCPRSGVVAATPHLPDTLQGEARGEALRGLLDGLIAAEKIVRPVRWYYTPMMLGFSRHIEAAAVVYDCMDELSHFKFAPPELRALERELLAEADVVFTGGFSLYEAKKSQHGNIHPFPSSVDRPHFAQARGFGPAQEPDDQAALPRPRLGFYGVIDERMDLELLARVADARPDWTLCIIGPVVKIDPAELPMRPNIRYLGGKAYADLPAYLAGWDAALMPFAINDSTKFISPTKTPEYLAGGRPVVSTPIADVIRHYGGLEGVKVARTPGEFVSHCEAALKLAADPDGAWLAEVDKALAELSWSQTFARMSALIDQAILKKQDEAEARQESMAAWAARAPAIRPSGRPRPFDYLVVGAGFAGSILAERLAAGSRKKVLVIDKRPHVAGNAFDHKDAAGVLIHRYGPHIFHTNSQEIVSYLSRFTRWRPYEHRVLACLGGLHVPIPINRTTVNTLYGLNLQTDEEVEAFFASRAEPVATIRTSEDVVVSKVGRELYERFFRGYTRKQWGLDPSALDKSVTARVPTRTNTDDRYFTDSFQCMPADGYTRMFENILDHDNIELMLGVEFEDIQGDVVYDQLIYTGPVDEYFDHRYGPLPYRSLEFRHETLDQAWFQPVGTVNYPAEEVPYTRVSEYKHLTGQAHAKTSITYEFPRAEGDPYYPVPRPENQALYKKYEALAQQTQDVTFVGRLATYRYYNMDQVAGQALAAYRRILEREGRAAALAELGATRAAAS
jgi:UDP-galactopyranose mutase